MINREDLSLLYNRDYIDEEKGSLTVRENNSQKTSLTEVTFLFNGNMLFVRQDVLQKSKDAYISKNKFGVNMKLNCDGLLILDSEDRHYLVYLEMKSSFNEVKKKAIYQIPSSYIKLNSILANFQSFDIEQYKKLGLIVSYPPKSKDKSEENSLVLGSKEGMIGNKLPMEIEKYNDQLRNKGITTLQGKDFSMDKMSCLSKNLTFENLVVKHHSVEDNCIVGTVDLNDVLSAI